MTGAHTHDEIGFLAHDACVSDTNRPTFDEEWQRRAFGVAVALSEFGHYPWEDFQRQLIDAIGSWERSPTAGFEYYDHWLAALERVVVDAGLATAAEVARGGPKGTDDAGDRSGDPQRCEPGIEGRRTASFGRERAGDRQS